MDKGKGTAREPEVDVDPDVDMATGSSGSPGSTLMSRMADSLSTLSRTLVAGAPSSDVLSRLGGAGEKRTASGSGSGSASLANLAGPSSSSRPEPPVPMRACPSAAAGAGTMRTTSAHEHDAAFYAFLRDGNTTPHVSALREQERRDGQHVVALLSAMDEDPPDLDEPEEDMASLGQALFGDKASGGTPTAAATDWDNMLNFTPAYLGSGGDDAARDEAAQHLGTRDLDEARRIWAGQWRRVLESYQDEVWGHLGDLVRDARTEVAALALVEGAGPPPEPKALLRLRSILGHLRGF